MSDKKDDKSGSITLTKTELQEMLTQASMAAGAGLAAALKPAQQVAKEGEEKAQQFFKGQRCHECRQLAKSCRGKHRQAIIFPRNEAVQDFFPGLRLNGVLYDSGPDMIPVTIPAEWDAENMMAAWVAAEIINIKGRKKNRNSGVAVPGKGITVNPEPVSF
jgi:hypothetical protein